MLRGGGLCLSGPGDPNLNKVSPRIKALQHRLMDSLPSDGAWECLSPAQREAILTLHRSRLASLDDSSEQGEGFGGAGRPGALRKPNRNQAFIRFARSRSYDDRLESETDDSGVRGVNGTNSSGAASHEDDSSDPGVKRGIGGRFSKAVSADRAMRRDVKNEIHELNNNLKNTRKTDVVTNGFGNVNKIISKQMNKCTTATSGTSNITLDCRNVQGEKKRRSRIDLNGPFRDCSLEKSLESIHENESSRRNQIEPQQNKISRKNILAENYESEAKLHSLKEMKETVSSEEYDSGVNFKNDDSVDEYVRNKQKNGCDFIDFESDQTPRSDTTSPTLPIKREISNERIRCRGDDLTTRKPSAEKDPFGGWDHSPDKVEKSRSRDKEGRSGMSQSLDKQYQKEKSSKSTKPNGEPLKSNLKVGYGAKLNSSFDYRNKLNQDQMNKYSSNWNNIILSHDVPIKPSSNNVSSSHTAAAGRESRFTKNAHAGALTRSTGNLANKSAMATAHRRNESGNWPMTDPRRTPNPSQDRAANKKYIRSKSLDRKYLDDDSSDDSDFETRRRNERTRRYNKSNQDWEASRFRVEDRGRHRSREMFEPRQNYNERQFRPKATSSWDLTGHSKKVSEDFDDFEDIGFRNRKDFRNQWQSEDINFVRRKRVSDNGEFSRQQWNRRSCDFELDFSSEERERKSSDKSVEFDRKRWYRRSCDLDLDFEYHNRLRREVEFDVDWDHRAIDRDDFETEVKGKRNRVRMSEQQLMQMQTRSDMRRMQDLSRSEMRRLEDHSGCDMRRMEEEEGRRTRMDRDMGRRVCLDEFGDNSLRVEESHARHPRIDDDPGRRTRLEEHYRSKTSMAQHSKEKRQRSRTPHLLRGKLQILKSILSF